MHTIRLDEREYILRCDLNVIEKINDQYGDISELNTMNISEIKEMVAMMINEHFYYIGSDETVTPKFVGSRIRGGGYKDLCEAIFGELNDCIKSKN